MLMVRLDYALSRGLDAGDVEELAKRAGVPVRWAKGRCEHGKTIEQTCYACEHGYVYDCHVYFLPRSEPFIAGATADNVEVAYISMRYRKKVEPVLEAYLAKEV